MNNIIQVTSKNFEKEVLQSDKPVLADFYATWCMPCKMIAPVLEKLALEFEGQIKFVKINVEKERPLAVRYGISGVPTLILFKGRIILDTIVGLLSPDALKSRLKWVLEIPKQQRLSQSI
jgi:thioredoxin 1